MTKVVFLIVDGLADRPIKQLAGQTPLEAASTPNLDQLAEKGITGLMDPIAVGVRPGSDTAHLALLGYNPFTSYPGRGVFEVLGIGLKPKPGDVCFRVNIGTVDEEDRIVDRRAGRVKDSAPFARPFEDLEIEGVKFLLKPGLGHRLGLIIRGENLSAAVTDGDPHQLTKLRQIKARDKSKAAEFTAQVLNKFLTISHRQLVNLPENKKRREAGQPTGNYFLIRGAGQLTSVDQFEKRWGLNAACLASGDLYKGVAEFLGMKIIKTSRPTGKKLTLASKLEKVSKFYSQYDFFFVHSKPTDIFSHDGDWHGKKKIVEKLDQEIEPLLGLKDALIVITADHSTPCSLKAHSGDPVPLLIAGPGVRVDQTARFGERPAANGGLGRIIGMDLMPEIVNLLGQATLFGN